VEHAFSPLGLKRSCCGITLGLFQMTYPALTRAEMLECCAPIHPLRARPRLTTGQSLRHALKNTLCGDTSRLQLGSIIASPSSPKRCSSAGAGLLFIQAVNFADVP